MGPPKKMGRVHGAGPSRPWQSLLWELESPARVLCQGWQSTFPSLTIVRHGLAPRSWSTLPGCQGVWGAGRLTRIAHELERPATRRGPAPASPVFGLSDKPAESRKPDSFGPPLPIPRTG